MEENKLFPFQKLFCFLQIELKNVSEKKFLRRNFENKSANFFWNQQTILGVLLKNLTFGPYQPTQKKWTPQNFLEKKNSDFLVVEFLVFVWSPVKFWKNSLFSQSGSAKFPKSGQIQKNLQDFWRALKWSSILPKNFFPSSLVVCFKIISIRIFRFLKEKHSSHLGNLWKKEIFLTELKMLNSLFLLLYKSYTIF